MSARRFRPSGTLIAAAALLSAAAFAAPLPIALAPGDPAPALEGTPVGGEALEGRYDAHPLTVVNFWATWCVPCRGEMPELQKLWERRSKDGLAVIGVQTDRSTGEASRKYLADAGVRYPVLLGGPAASQEWGGVAVLPTTFLVGRDGRIVRKYVGSNPESVAGLLADVEAILEGRPLGRQILPQAPPVAPSGEPK